MQIIAQFGFTGRRNMEIRTFGGGRRLCECYSRLSKGKELCASRLILLPIPTARDNKYITGTTTTVGEIAEMLDSNTLVAGYNIPNDITDAAGHTGTFVYDGAFDEEFLSANAELTARGALGYILTNSNKDIGDMHIGVVGYGRIGSRLVRWLLPFGAKVTVYTGRREVALELGELGVSAQADIAEWAFSSLDLLVNTAPARQIDEAKIPEELRIIDLASGNIFTPSSRLVKLSSIPDALYPLTAGRLYAERIIDFFGGKEE